MTLYRQVARLHIAAIDQGFLPQLGERFLAHLYHAIDHSDASVLITRHDEQGRLAGFISGGGGMRPILRCMLRRWPLVLWSLVPALTSVRTVGGIVELARRSGSAPDGDYPANELFSIAVAPDARQSGHARWLYGRLEEHFRAQGVGAFRIVVGEQLVAAHHFYRRMGAEPVGTVEVHRGERSVVYLQRTARGAS